MMPKICERINVESVSVSLYNFYHIVHCCSEADTRILVRMRCHPCQSGVAIGHCRGGYMDYKNSHLSCMWEQESELGAVYRINCVGPESLFLVEWGALSRWCPTPDTTLQCCPWSRNIHQLLSNSPDIVLQCSLVANTEGKQIIISIFSLWYLLSWAFKAMP